MCWTVMISIPNIYKAVPFSWTSCISISTAEFAWLKSSLDWSFPSIFGMLTISVTGVLSSSTHGIDLGFEEEEICDRPSMVDIFERKIRKRLEERDSVTSPPERWREPRAPTGPWAEPKCLGNLVLRRSLTAGKQTHIIERESSIVEITEMAKSSPAGVRIEDREGERTYNWCLLRTWTPRRILDGPN